jgi:hypothetical protein
MKKQWITVGFSSNILAFITSAKSHKVMSKGNRYIVGKSCLALKNCKHHPNWRGMVISNCAFLQSRVFRTSARNI